MWDVEDEDSDDEVFFGEIRLKEVKRSISITSKQRQTFCTTDSKTTTEDKNNRSIKIIETHSTPNIRTSICISNARTSLKCSSDTCFHDTTTPASDNQDTDTTDSTMPVISASELASHMDMEPLSYLNITNESLLSNLDVHKPDDSFLQIEKLIDDLSVKPDKKSEKNNVELDNTLDVIDYILNNGNINDSEKKQPGSKSNQEKGILHVEGEHALQTNMIKLQSVLKTPAKTDRSVYTMKSNETNLKTPNTKTLMFKTPGNPVSNKKILTPFRKQFEHVVSPVASYINDSPRVPLIKNVRPKKPLHGTSFIPQPIKIPSKMNVCNKENQNLPSTAYRCAKETKLIDLPEEHKLPQSQWAKHVASSLQKGIVMKHIHRETSSTKKLLFQQQEDSFSNLTLHQADLSVCTQKSAVKKAL